MFQPAVHPECRSPHQTESAAAALHSDPTAGRSPHPSAGSRQHGGPWVSGGSGGKTGATLLGGHSTQAAADSPPIDVLLQRMQAGDRRAAAEFLLRYESRIRRRIRGKLGPSVRRLFDSLDIFSTLGRRLDDYVLSGRLRAGSEGECLTLLFNIADHALIDKARLVQRLESAEGEDSEFAHLMASRLRHTGRRAPSSMDAEIEYCMRLLSDPEDRRILSLWLTGESHLDIAVKMNIPATAVRKRWQTIRETLREGLQIHG